MDKATVHLEDGMRRGWRDCPRQKMPGSVLHPIPTESLGRRVFSSPAQR